MYNRTILHNRVLKLKDIFAARCTAHREPIGSRFNAMSYLETSGDVIERLVRLLRGHPPTPRKFPNCHSKRHSIEHYLSKRLLGPFVWGLVDDNHRLTRYFDAEPKIVAPILLPNQLRPIKLVLMLRLPYGW